MARRRLDEQARRRTLVNTISSMDANAKQCLASVPAACDNQTECSLAPSSCKGDLIQWACLMPDDLAPNTQITYANQIAPTATQGGNAAYVPSASMTCPVGLKGSALLVSIVSADLGQFFDHKDVTKAVSDEWLSPGRGPRPYVLAS